jgi:hypothetical protein
MSKLFENKQLLHITTEVVVLGAVLYYVSTKFKTLNAYTQDLGHRLAEQEQLLEKQGQQIEQLKSLLLSRTKSKPVTSAPSPVKKKTQPKQPEKVDPIQNILSSVSFFPMKQSTMEVEVVDEDSDNEEELDKELEDELKELEEKNQDLKPEEAEY